MSAEFDSPSQCNSNDRIAAIVRGDDGDPFSFLGMHRRKNALIVRAFLPEASNVAILRAEDGQRIARFERVHDAGLFACVLEGMAPFDYRLRIESGSGVHVSADPYAFRSVTGAHRPSAESSHAPFGFESMGAQRVLLNGMEGTNFTFWAPEARRVSVVGDFNGWDRRRHPMRFHPDTGNWDIFIPGAPLGAFYKFAVKQADGEDRLWTDPYAFALEPPPNSAAIIHGLPKPLAPGNHVPPSPDSALSIYAVHAGAWLSALTKNGAVDYRSLSRLLIPYARALGFTHLLLLQVRRSGSIADWPLYGPYAPVGDRKTPGTLRTFIGKCHEAGLGVILERPEPDRPMNSDMLQADAQFWATRYGVDGLSTGTAIMLRDVPGRMDDAVADRGEDLPLKDPPSGAGTAYGTGASAIDDILRYIQTDPVRRAPMQDLLISGLNGVTDGKQFLPISAQGCARTARSLLSGMPGDRLQKFANLRAYLGLTFTMPGNKCLQMGDEFGSSSAGEPEWLITGDPFHKGTLQLVQDLNRLYRTRPALHRPGQDGFRWVDTRDCTNSVVSFIRRSGGPAAGLIFVICNLSDAIHRDYRIGVPYPVLYRECLNTDSVYYGGSNAGNMGAALATEQPLHGFPASLSLTLPPLSVLVFEPDAHSR